MILRSLTPKRKMEFEKWCTENFGFHYSIKDFGDESESTSVIVVEGDGGEHNLTDSGFGYSQVFPIVLAIWLNLSEKPNKHDLIVVIEQPELHLHPAFQKKILDIFTKVFAITAKSRAKIKFVLETHSETIVNYLGSLIARDVVSKEDVNLIVADKAEQHTRFTSMVFDNQGIIENWPVGFFSEE